MCHLGHSGDFFQRFHVDVSVRHGVAAVGGRGEGRGVGTGFPVPRPCGHRDLSSSGAEGLDQETEYLW